MGKKSKGAKKKSRQRVVSPTGQGGYGNVDSAGNLVLDYQEFFGCTAMEMAGIIQRYTAEDWTGIGVDPNSGGGSFETVIQAVGQEPSGVPAIVDRHIVILCQLSGDGGLVEYFDPADNNTKTMSIHDLRENIRAAAVPSEIGEGVMQTDFERSLLYEPAFS